MSDDNGEMSHQEFRGYVERFRQLIITKRRSDYDLGKWLHDIKSCERFRVWPRVDSRGYDTWVEFCEIEVNLKTSTVYTLIRNYTSLSAIGIDEDSDTFARCMRLGYSKLARVLTFVNSEQDVIEWLTIIEDEELSEMALRARISAARRDTATQNVEEARAAGEPIEEAGPDEQLSPTNPTGWIAHTMRFPDQESIESFSQAVDMIRRRYDLSLSVGRCVSMMAVQYLATAPSDAEGGAPVELENVIRLFESAYNVRLEVVTDDEPTGLAAMPSLAARRAARRRRRLHDEASSI